MNICWWKHPEIDKEKYDRSIGRSLNGTVYALSWYLDTVCEDWQLLATPDYSYVMPLPVKKKIGYTYSIQPFMAQQLGLFSSSHIRPEILRAFIDKIPFPVCYMQLNAGNQAANLPFSFRSNYVLDMDRDYTDIQALYHSNTKNQLKKVNRLPLIFEKQVQTGEALRFVEKHSQHYTGKLYDVFRKLAGIAAEKEILHIVGAREETHSGYLAVAFFFVWNRSFYYILPTSSFEGNKVQAMRFLLDRLIAEYAGKGYRIDFEGSSIPSVAQFYKSFGAQEIPYPVYETPMFRLLKTLSFKA